MKLRRTLPRGVSAGLSWQLHADELVDNILALEPYRHGALRWRRYPGLDPLAISDLIGLHALTEDRTIFIRLTVPSNPLPDDAELERLYVHPDHHEGSLREALVASIRARGSILPLPAMFEYRWPSRQERDALLDRWAVDEHSRASMLEWLVTEHAHRHGDRNTHEDGYYFNFIVIRLITLRAEWLLKEVLQLDWARDLWTQTLAEAVHPPTAANAWQREMQAWYAQWKRQHPVGP